MFTVTCKRCKLERSLKWKPKNNTQYCKKCIQGIRKEKIAAQGKSLYSRTCNSCGETQTLKKRPTSKICYLCSSKMLGKKMSQNNIKPAGTKTTHIYFCSYCDSIRIVTNKRKTSSCGTCARIHKDDKKQIIYFDFESMTTIHIAQVKINKAERAKSYKAKYLLKKKKEQFSVNTKILNKKISEKTEKISKKIEKISKKIENKTKRTVKIKVKKRINKQHNVSNPTAARYLKVKTKKEPILSKKKNETSIKRRIKKSKIISNEAIKKAVEINKKHREIEKNSKAIAVKKQSEQLDQDMIANWIKDNTIKVDNSELSYSGVGTIRSSTQSMDGGSFC